MEDNDIWLRIKAAEIVAQYFDGTCTAKTFCNHADKVYQFIKNGSMQL